MPAGGGTGGFESGVQHAGTICSVLPPHVFIGVGGLPKDLIEAKYSNAKSYATIIRVSHRLAAFVGARKVHRLDGPGTMTPFSAVRDDHHFEDPSSPRHWHCLV